MSLGWIDISESTFYGDYNGYIRYANQLLNISGAATEESGNGLRVFSVPENTRFRVTLLMQNRFRLACVSNLTSGQTVTNCVFSPFDTNDATNQGTLQSLEITSEPGQIFLCVGAWSVGAGDTIFNTLNTIVLEAYMESFEVTFVDWNGEVLKTERVIEHKAATAPPTPARGGYIFTGWDVAFDDVTTDLTVTAQYRAIGTYQVMFKNYDGMLLKTEYVLEGGTATAPAVPDREDYNFSGWDVPFDNVLSDLVTTAQFTPKVYHTVRFLDWDEEILKTETVEHGASATAPDAPIRDGYRFLGWDAPCREILSDLDVHALYEQIIYCTVRFLNWDASELKTERVELGGTATPPSNPTRSGYTFTGWLPTVFTNIRADTDFTAQYEIIIVYRTVKFYSDGVLLSSQQVADGTDAIPPLPPQKTDYIFDHWDADFSKVTANLTVNAVYRAALDHTVILVYSASGALLQTIDKVLSANLRESLEGELTFEFSTLAGRGEYIYSGCIAEYEGDYFNIVRVAKTISSGLMTVAATCEHISYVLNDDRYKISVFDFTGLPAAGLTQLLAGTQFSAGTVEFTDSVTMKINQGVTRREALMQFVAICGGEIEYNGHYINLRKHRGSTTIKQLMDGKKVTDVSVTFDSRSATESYEVAFHKVADFSVGDEVQIVFSPMHINTRTRIIAMEYNPFYKYSIRVEVGSYKPTINDNLYRIEKSATDNSDDMSTIWNEFDNMSGAFDSFESDYGNFLDTYKAVQNIAVGASSFTVTYTDGSMATFNYSVDAAGRMTSITRVV
ncbi:MAG: InlB B-repeat-containing protein [Erysipelotrichaceae bacterium]|nr:InlB B-repeat-containing protein [Erysipelotrichaceae bacterium]